MDIRKLCKDWQSRLEIGTDSRLLADIKKELRRFKPTSAQFVFHELLKVLNAINTALFNEISRFLMEHDSENRASYFIPALLAKFSKESREVR